MNALVPFTEMQGMAEVIAASGLFGIKRPQEALALMIVAQAENRHPGSVAAEYHIIQGRPALKADAMLARFQQAGGKVAWDVYTDDKVSAVFTHDAGGSIKVEWDMARAKKAGLGTKDNWVKYPRQMLRARVISEGVRSCYPAVCVGVYTVEEVQEFDDKPAKDKSHWIGKGKPLVAKDMGTAEVVDSDGVITKPADDPVASHTETLQYLCKTAGHDYAKLLAKAEVKSAEEMSEEDYDSAVRMLNRKIAAALKASAEEAV